LALLKAEERDPEAGRMANPGHFTHGKNFGKCQPPHKAVHATPLILISILARLRRHSAGER